MDRDACQNWPVKASDVCFAKKGGERFSGGWGVVCVGRLARRVRVR
jgi:hypothetical protein